MSRATCKVGERNLRTAVFCLERISVEPRKLLLRCQNTNDGMDLTAFRGIDPTRCGRDQRLKSNPRLEFERPPANSVGRRKGGPTYPWCQPAPVSPARDTRTEVLEK